MRYRRLVGFLLIAAIVLAATSASALDGTRKGFILGFSIGPGVTSWSQEISAAYGSLSAAVKSETENSFGVATDFKIGGGITEQFLLYYENRVSWFTVEYVAYNLLGDITTVDVTVAHAIGLLGASYYFQADAPSLYVLGSLGISTWQTPFESGSETYVGFGLSGGLGYEFSKHWFAEGTLNYGKPTKQLYGVDFSYNALSVMVTVGGMLY